MAYTSTEAAGRDLILLQCSISVLCGAVLSLRTHLAIETYAKFIVIVLELSVARLACGSSNIAKYLAGIIA
jgi:hypothetical protein